MTDQITLQYEIQRLPYLSPAAKVVAWNLLLRAGLGSDRRCNPRRRKIAEDCGLHLETVDTSLAQLESLGIVSIERVQGRSNQYVLNPPERWTFPENPPSRRNPSSEETPLVDSSPSPLRKKPLGGSRKNPLGSRGETPPSKERRKKEEKETRKEEPPPSVETTSGYGASVSISADLILSAYEREFGTLVSNKPAKKFSEDHFPSLLAGFRSGIFDERGFIEKSYAVISTIIAAPDPASLVSTREECRS